MDVKIHYLVSKSIIFRSLQEETDTQTHTNTHTHTLYHKQISSWEILGLTKMSDDTCILESLSLAPLFSSHPLFHLFSSTPNRAH